MLQTFIFETSNYLNCVLTLIIIISAESNELKKYINPIKINSLRFNFFLNNIRDHALCL
jgi:hypothetical protein